MERVLGERRGEAGSTSAVESDKKTMSPLLFQQLRSKFGDDIEFRADTSILDSIIKVAASSEKTSRTKQNPLSVAYDRFSRVYDRFSRVYDRFSR